MWSSLPTFISGCIFLRACNIYLSEKCETKCRTSLLTQGGTPGFKWWGWSKKIFGFEIFDSSKYFLCGLIYTLVLILAPNQSSLPFEIWRTTPWDSWHHFQCVCQSRVISKRCWVLRQRAIHAFFAGAGRSPSSLVKHWKQSTQKMALYSNICQIQHCFLNAIAGI